MPHDTPLISTIVVGFVLAFVLGAAAHRLKLPPLVGYLVAGVLCGPYTPGFVADQSLAPQLAEIGVILLMFGVGLHFSLKDLLNVRGIAVPGAIAQISLATLMGWALGMAMGWSHGGSVVFGLALSVASTVVLLKALQDRRLVETERGRIAVGWLIVEDLAMVLALVIIPAVASIANGNGAAQASGAPVNAVLGFDLGIAGVLAFTVLKVAAFVALMLLVGRKFIPWVLHRIANMGSRELFRLGVLAIALGVAFGAAKLFGVSLALGAFFAGMILAESELSQRAAQESLPLRDAFAVLFFVSVGMLFDPAILWTEPLPMLGVLFIILAGKSVVAFLIVLAFGKSVSTALTISASLAQIGEFSFILAELGVGLKLLPPEGRDLILGGAILSIILNPLVFYLCDRMRPALEAALGRSPAPAAEPVRPAPIEPAPDVVTSSADDTGEQEAKPTRLSGHAVLVGFGRVGGIVARKLKAAGAPFLVIEDADMRVASTRALGIEAIAGNAAETSVLELANLRGAKSLIIAIPDAFEAGRITESARETNPGIMIVARAHSDAEVDHLTKLGADSVIMGEREIALALIQSMVGAAPAADSA
ncbi:MULTISPECIES: YbaL family putative K(+) efflux transporter [Rhodomicrobium]|uniref:YbaL family putative K(+) efflux transporter n=1 Tax=Rhodomicrobium TaxID=1068 RepID=UPI000B4B10E5|nr:MULTISPECIES: YbaL family putative K(+) efflux transporter [Rhodomicrobium]